MMAEVYQTSQIKRHRATKAEMEERRNALFDIVAEMRPMTVRCCHRCCHGNLASKGNAS